MIPYKNLNGNSNVKGYECGPDYIDVYFYPSGIYTYNYYSTGRGHVETMKMLAQEGCGLNGYINSYCKNRYARKR